MKVNELIHVSDQLFVKTQRVQTLRSYLRPHSIMVVEAHLSIRLILSRARLANIMQQSGHTQSEVRARNITIRICFQRNSAVQNHQRVLIHVLMRM